MTSSRRSSSSAGLDQEKSRRRSDIERRLAACFHKHGGVIVLATGKEGNWSEELLGKLVDQVRRPHEMDEAEFGAALDLLLLRMYRDNTLVISSRNGRVSVKLDAQLMHELAREEGRRRKMERELARGSRLPKPRYTSPRFA